MGDLTTVDLDLMQWVLFAVAGIITGVINTLAGSGSLITLPLFIFLCGLSAPVANGTNRIGALIQNVVGVYSLRKTGQLEMKGSVWLLVPIVIGGIAGALVATDLNEEAMNYTLGGLMVFMLFVLLLDTKRWIRESAVDEKRNKRPVTLLIFLAIGFYGGFIQAGVGIFLLAALVLSAHYSLVAANGIKLLVVGLINIPSLIIFLYYDQVHIVFGLLMALFQAIGAVIGVKVIAKIPNANVWIYRLLIVIVVISAVKFFVG
ncbi:MAG: sulfite exporter TauE/SafE family protein [Bacteroidia bacterium]|nr:sulfite exporter TauE/SafE family protein [Bacteroidia bacterium]